MIRLSPLYGSTFYITIFSFDPGKRKGLFDDNNRGWIDQRILQSIDTILWRIEHGEGLGHILETL